MNLFEQMKHELAEEMFSSFSYNIPSDPQQKLYDFYFLSLFINKPDTRNEMFNQSAQEACVSLTNYLQQHLSEVLKWSLIYEFEAWLSENYRFQEEERLRRNKFTEKEIAFMTELYDSPPSTKNSGKLSNDYLKYRLPGELKNNKKYKITFGKFLSLISKHNVSNLDFAVLIRKIHALGWGRDTVGKKWDKIANCYYNLLVADTLGDKIVWIDTTYNLQHTYGSIFEKCMSYAKKYKNDSYYSGFGDEEYAWVLESLTWKRNNMDIRGFYDKVSPQLRSMVAFASKNIYGQTMEDYFKFPEEMLEVSEKDFLKKPIFYYTDLADYKPYKIMKALASIRDESKNEKMVQYASKIIDMLHKKEEKK